jgi:hypothetical protein
MTDPEPIYHASLILVGVTKSDTNTAKKCLENDTKVMSVHSLLQTLDETFHSSYIRFTTC